MLTSRRILQNPVSIVHTMSGISKYNVSDYTVMITIKATLLSV